MVPVPLQIEDDAARHRQGRAGDMGTQHRFGMDLQ